MRPYPQEFRERVLAALGRGEPASRIARRLEVSRHFVYGVRDRLVRENQRNSRRVGGYRQSVIGGMESTISEWINAEPDVTLQELSERLAAQGKALKVPALWHQLNRWGLTFKKTLHASEQERPDVQEARTEWKAQQASLVPARLVFLDETGAATNMTRRYGRALRGQRCVAYTPYGHRKTTTFIAGLRHDRVTAPLVIDGPMDGAIFLAYVQDFLCPTLQPGDPVIADNLSSHKVTGVREAIEAVGAQIRYLPPYSPDLNPIEKLFAKLKALLRKAAKRTVEALWTHIGTLLDAFTPIECANDFASSEYVGN
ncbi:MAG: IS630 family transposase [Panacagrimonas sp.]